MTEQKNIGGDATENSSGGANFTWFNPFSLIALSTSLFYLMGYKFNQQLAVHFGLASFPTQPTFQSLVADGFAVTVALIVDILLVLFVMLLAAIFFYWLKNKSKKSNKILEKTNFNKRLTVAFFIGFFTAMIFSTPYLGGKVASSFANRMIETVLNGCNENCRDYKFKNQKAVRGISIFVDGELTVIYTKQGVRVYPSKELTNIKSVGSKPSHQIDAIFYSMTFRLLVDYLYNPPNKITNLK